MKTPVSDRVGIYCRLSDEDRDKGDLPSESIQNQIEMLSSYCKSKGWHIFDIYCDEDYSGADRNRPAFSRMISDCKAGRIDTVLCKTQSRFSRDMEIIEKYIHGKFCEWNIRFIGLVDNVDSCDKSNKKTRQINGLVNEWYLEDLSENIKKTLRSKNRCGKFTGAFAPYGYIADTNNKNRLMIDEYAANIVREIFRMYLIGFGYKAIADCLNACHILPPTLYKKQQGSKYQNLNACSLHWTPAGIRYILTQEVYIGRTVSHKSEKISFKSDKRVSVSDKERIRVENTHDPIIDKSIWDRAQTLIASKKRASRCSNKVYALSGAVFCGDDNHKMIISTSNGYRYLICKHCKIRCRYEDLESAVLNEINKQCRNIIKRPIKNDTRRAHLEKAVRQRKQEIDIVYNDRLTGTISIDMFRRKYEELEKEIAVLNCELSEIETEKSVNSGQVFARLKPELFSMLIEKLSLAKNGAVTIFWKF